MTTLYNRSNPLDEGKKVRLIHKNFSPIGGEPTCQLVVGELHLTRSEFEKKFQKWKHQKLCVWYGDTVKYLEENLRFGNDRYKSYYD